MPVLYWLAGTISVAAAIFLFGGFFIVRETERKVILRFGKYSWVAKPGLNWRVLAVDQVQRPITLRTRELVVKVGSKTKDEVAVTVEVNLQFSVDSGLIREYFIGLENPDNQISSYAADFVRGWVAGVEIGKVFGEKNELAEAVVKSLNDKILEFGCRAVSALIIRIDAGRVYEDALNAKKAANLLLGAANDKAEAEKIITVARGEAEKKVIIAKGEADREMMIAAAQARAEKIRLEAAAEAEAMRLRGQGIADERSAILDGLNRSMILLKGEMADSDPRDIITLVLMEEWIKALENIGTTNGRTIMIPSSPGQLGEFGDQIRNLLLGVVEAAKGNGLPELTVGSEPVSGSEDSAPPA